MASYSALSHLLFLIFNKSVPLAVYQSQNPFSECTSRGLETFQNKSYICLQLHLQGHLCQPDRRHSSTDGGLHAELHYLLVHIFLLLDSLWGTSPSCPAFLVSVKAKSEICQKAESVRGKVYE